MMNLTGNDWQFGQGGQRVWTFCYRVVLLEQNFDAVRAVAEANRFATPPFLKVPGQPPCLPGLDALRGRPFKDLTVEEKLEFQALTSPTAEGGKTN